MSFPSHTHISGRQMMAGIALGASVLGAFFNIRAYERRRRREAEHGGGGEGEVHAGGGNMIMYYCIISIISIIARRWR
jgi:hypothetical protein